MSRSRTGRPDWALKPFPLQHAYSFAQRSLCGYTPRS